MHDTDHPNGDGQPTPPPLVTQSLGYVHPAGFNAAAFLIIGMDQQGKAFVNMPTNQPHLALHLATLALDYASKMAVTHMQNELAKQSPIVVAPAGIVPPWNGPAGRG